MSNSTLDRTFQTRDGRLVARVILLAHRFGCDYTDLCGIARAKRSSTANDIASLVRSLRITATPRRSDRQTARIRKGDCLIQ